MLISPSTQKMIISVMANKRKRAKVENKNLQRHLNKVSVSDIYEAFRRN
jgi:hypothetical protein